MVLSPDPDTIFVPSGENAANVIPLGDELPRVREPRIHNVAHHRCGDGREHDPLKVDHHLSSFAVDKAVANMIGVRLALGAAHLVDFVEDLEVGEAFRWNQREI